jgi:PleD family two-component response regulator
VKVNRILVIDDSGDIAAAIERMCEGAQAEIERSPNALHGVMRASECEPALILITARQAWLGSLPMTEALRRDRRLRTIPVVTLADQGHTPDSLKDGQRLGANSLYWPEEREKLAQRLCQVTNSAPSSVPAAVV